MTVAIVKQHVTHDDEEGDIDGGGFLYVWCPGCDMLHTPCVRRAEGKSNSRWEWNGETEEPTLSPSILVKMMEGDNEKVCHSFLVSGKWRFLSDSTHDLAGQDQIEMVELPAWVGE